MTEGQRPDGYRTETEWEEMEDAWLLEGRELAEWARARVSPAEWTPLQWLVKVQLGAFGLAVLGGFYACVAAAAWAWSYLWRLLSETGSGPQETPGRALVVVGVGALLALLAFILRLAEKRGKAALELRAGGSPDNSPPRELLTVSVRKLVARVERTALWQVAVGVLAFVVFIGGLSSLRGRGGPDGLVSPLQDLVKVAAAAAALAVIGTAMRVITGRRLDALARQGFDREKLERALYEGEGKTRAEVAAMEETEAAEATAFRRELSADKPTWQTELSGGHLVWNLSWVALAILPFVTWDERPPWSLLVASLWAVAVCGVVLKVAGPLFLWTSGWRRWRLATPEEAVEAKRYRREIIRYYRWWGQGVVPILIAIAPGILYWVAVWTGWLASFLESFEAF